MTVTLEKVRSLVTAGLFGSSEPWGGADVMVVATRQQRSFAVYSFFPEPLCAVTPHVGPVSWFFEQIRDCFGELDGYGFFKEGLFGDLGDAVNAITKKSPDISAQELLLALLDLADSLYVELSAPIAATGGGGF